jgi:N-acyl-D-aspartate/D-glutamate deacylase
MPTFMLSFWTRDRSRGEKLPLEMVVQKLTEDCAHTYELFDRGTLEPGRIADLNVIDYDNLRLGMPEVVYDLPKDGMRFIQKAEGYVATVKSGEVIFENGEATGALPGALIRGPQNRGKG